MRKYFLTAGLIFMAVFALFTFLVSRDLLIGFDLISIIGIQRYIPKNLDVILSFFSLLGSVEILSILLFAIIVSRRKLISLIPFFLFIAAHIIEIFGKSLLTHPGPPFRFFRYNLPFLFPSSYVQPGSSYPSGHSLRVVFLSIVVVYLIHSSRKLSSRSKFILKFLAAAFMILMLVTRVSLGEHWLTDVIGGSLLGAGFGFISLMFF